MRGYPLVKRVFRGVMLYRLGVLGRGVCMKQEQVGLHDGTGVKRALILTPFDSPLFNNGNGIVSLLSKSYVVMMMLLVYMRLDGVHSFISVSKQGLELNLSVFGMYYMMILLNIWIVFVVAIVVTSQLSSGTNPISALKEGRNYPFVQFLNLGYILLMEVMIVYMCAHGGWGEMIGNALTEYRRDVVAGFFGVLWLLGFLALQFSLLVMLANTLLLEVVDASLHKNSLKLVDLGEGRKGVLLIFPCERLKPFKVFPFVPQRYIPTLLIGLFVLSGVTQLCLNESQFSGTFTASMIFNSLLLLLLGGSCVVGSRVAILEQIAYEQNRLTGRNVKRHLRRRVKRKASLQARVSGPGPMIF